LVWSTADHDGLAAVLRMVTLLHGGKEGIHVDVDDFTRHRFRIVQRFAFSL
jgi:hypothetical protein